MYGSSPPIFPQFALNEFFWVTSAKLPAWSGYQIRNGPYGSISEDDSSDGTVHIVFAPEGRGKGPLSKDEVGRVKWLIDHQADVHEAMLNRLFEEYPAIREQAMDWYDGEEATRLLPEVRHPEELKRIVGIVSINVHVIEEDGQPFIGIELGCTWEEEHGLGILLHGARALEVGQADIAFTLWVANKYLRNQS